VAWFERFAGTGVTAGARSIVRAWPACLVLVPILVGTVGGAEEQPPDEEVDADHEPAQESRPDDGAAGHP
jgi:hypothetical protein